MDDSIPPITALDFRDSKDRSDVNDTMTGKQIKRLNSKLQDFSLVHGSTRF